MFTRFAAALLLAFTLSVGGATALQMPRIHLSLPIHGHFAFVVNDQNIILLNTYNGEIQTLVQSPDDTIEKSIDSPAFSHNGEYLAYRNGNYGTGIANVATGISQMWGPFPGHRSSFQPIGWSQADSNILYINDDYISLNPLLTVEKFVLFDVSTGELTSLRNFVQYQIYTDLPLPAGITQFRFNGVSNFERNPVFDRWIALQLRGSNPEITYPNPDTGSKDEEEIWLSLLWNYETGQMISLDHLFDLPIGELPFIWSQDGKKLLVYLEGEDTPRHVAIIKFEATATDASVAAGLSIETKKLFLTWLGAGNLTITASFDYPNQLVRYYISEITNEKINLIEFLDIPTSIIPATAISQFRNIDWYITASEQEKQALASLFE